MASHRPNPRRRPDQVQKLQEARVFALVLGAVIERLRRQHAWTQAQLAERVGVSQPVISRIEAGKLQPPAYLYGQLATTFGMSVQSLDQHVNEAMQTAKRAAEAVSAGNKSWDELLSVVGTLGLVGLIVFAVAALLDGGGGKLPVPKR